MPHDPFRFADTLGPAKVLHIHLAEVGIKAVVVVDNTACGPAIGGVRMAVDATAEEAFRLARAMTFKNAAAGLPHGGGKSVIIGDPRIAAPAKEQIVRAFAAAIAELTDYIPGPDMGTDEHCMGLIADEIGRAVGLPREIGGIPLDEIGATGIGLASAIDVASADIELPLRGARVAVQGFGAVGKHAAKALAARGAILVAASDTRGTVIDPAGLDVGALIKIKDQGGSVIDHRGGRRAEADAVIDVPCDIWVPAARPDVVRADNVDRLKTKIVAQGANIPVTPEAEQILHARGVLALPDFIANAGGVICASVEYHGGTEAAALATVDEKIRRNMRQVLDDARRTGTTPRAAAVALAESRVRAAMRIRRWR